MEHVGTRDMVDLLVEDHHEVESMFQELEAGSGTPDERRRLAHVVVAELVRHAVAEEQHLYPTARRALPDGDREADREIEEHAAAEQKMRELERLEATEPRFEELLSALMADIRHHIFEEERSLFPRLRGACDEAELAELGKKLEWAKAVAPTRPHPDAPDTPPANRITAPGAGLVDRVRDGLQRRANDPGDLG